MPKVLAFSGSPIKNGTMEKGIKAVLEATGAQTEFIRLADLDMKICIGCKKCAVTNRCIFKDDVNDVLEKIIEADALVFSGYPSFGSINALSKVFIERLWPLRHNHLFTKGKVGAAVACSSSRADSETLASYFEMYLTMYLQTRYQGTLALAGNVPCMSCGYGEECDYSGWLRLKGPGAKVTPDDFVNFDTDKDAQERAAKLGQSIANALANPA